MTRRDARVTILGVPDVPGTSLETFARIADRKITVDMIVQNVSTDGRSDISFTVPQHELELTLQAVCEVAQQLGARDIAHDDNVCKVSVVGSGMARQTGVADRMFQALGSAGINIQMITTSEIKISVLVERDQATRALRTVHEAFELDREPGSRSAALPVARRGAATADVADVITRLRDADMEKLVIDDIALDVSQARVTINGVPDTPGVAGQVFRRIADAGIFVDMIVQSYDGIEGSASLSFTVPRGHREEAIEVAEGLAEQFRCQSVTSCPEVAKLSVSGIGLQSHTSVGIRMFRALAEAGINVDMISTSEVRVNVVVDGARGQQALTCLQNAFADVVG